MQWGLFGGAIQALGNPEQHARYLPAVMDLSLPGCFGMTETGHGSDVQSVHTTATYDPATGEFVVDTPTESARKDYIGGLAAASVRVPQTHFVACETTAIEKVFAETGWGRAVVKPMTGASGYSV